VESPTLSRSGPDRESRRSAAALARLLLYAELDAMDLGDIDLARSIKQLAGLCADHYGLEPSEIIPGSS